MENTKIMVRDYDTNVIKAFLHLHSFACDKFNNVYTEDVIEVVKENFEDFCKFDEVMVQVMNSKNIEINYYESLEMFYTPIFKKEFVYKY